jgi:hypothetical protein
LDSTHQVAPVLPGGWVLLGETMKLVPISNQRIVSVSIGDQQLKVEVRGAVGEEVEFGASTFSAAPSVLYSKCTVASGGTCAISFNN